MKRKSPAAVEAPLPSKKRKVNKDVSESPSESKKKRTHIGDVPAGGDEFDIPATPPCRERAKGKPRVFNNNKGTIKISEAIGEPRKSRKSSASAKLQAKPPGRAPTTSTWKQDQKIGEMDTAEAANYKHPKLPGTRPQKARSQATKNSKSAKIRQPAQPESKKNITKGKRRVVSIRSQRTPRAAAQLATRRMRGIAHGSKAEEQDHSCQIMVVIKQQQKETERLSSDPDGASTCSETHTSSNHQTAVSLLEQSDIESQSETGINSNRNHEQYAAYRKTSFSTLRTLLPVQLPLDQSKEQFSEPGGTVGRTPFLPKAKAPQQQIVPLFLPPAVPSFEGAAPRRDRQPTGHTPGLKLTQERKGYVEIVVASASNSSLSSSSQLHGPSQDTKAHMEELDGFMTLLNDPVQPEQSMRAKRRSHTRAGRALLQHNRHFLDESVPKISSQGSRVNENGSPRPLQRTGVARLTRGILNHLDEGSDSEDSEVHFGGDETMIAEHAGDETPEHALLPFSLPTGRPSKQPGYDGCQVAKDQPCIIYPCHEDPFLALIHNTIPLTKCKSAINL